MNFTTKYLNHYEAVCIGPTILTFSMKQTKADDTNILIYDVSKDQWTEKECFDLKNLTGISCAKYYEE